MVGINLAVANTTVIKGCILEVVRMAASYFDLFL